jgi:GT2 family glycosyltransferase
MTRPAVAVVMLAYGDEPVLHDAVRSVLGSEGVDVSVVLVDNGCTSDAVSTLPSDERVQVLVPDENLGFAGGVNHGAAVADAPYLCLVNSDAEVDPGAIAALVRVAARPDVGIASGSIRLADRPDLMNSAGNPVHVVGLSWAGAFEEPASEHAEEREIASASGAGLVLRREVWDRLGGFDATYFAYHEDVDLSWRAWQLGLRVLFVPDAVVYHHYEFSRNSRKMFLLERNRRIFLATLYGPRLRAVTALPTWAVGVALGIVARGQGWAPEHRQARQWIRAHGPWLRERRAAVARSRTVDDRTMARLLTPVLDQQVFPLPPGSGVLQALMRGYWAVARRLL